MFNFNNFLILLIFIFIILLIIRYYANRCNKIKYKYISRTFKEEQDYPTYVSDIFGDMFIDPTPWIIGQSGNKKRRIN